MNLREATSVIATNLPNRACSGYQLTATSHGHQTFLGFHPTAETALDALAAHIRLLINTMGEGTAATSDTGLAIIFATTTVNFTLTARECEGHDTTYRPTALSPESTSIKRLELRRTDYHDASGDHTETEWHVAISGDSTETLNPRDIPQVVDALQDMHALWVDCAD